MASAVYPGLFVGDMADAKAAPPDFFILCVLENRPPDEPPNATHIPFLVNGKADMKQVDIILDVIDRQIQANRQILVHCGAGIERSPLICTLYLHKRVGLPLDDAWKLVQQKRPQAQDRRGWLQPSPQNAC